MRYLILPNGESVDVIYEMERQCNDFGPFKETVDEILFRKFKGEDNSTITDKLQQQIEYYVNTFDEDRQSTMSFSQMCDTISGYFNEYYNSEYELTEDELTQIEKGLNQYMVTAPEFRNLYYSYLCTTEYEELVEDLMAEIMANIHSYVLPKEHLDIAWWKIGKRVIDMDSIHKRFKDIVIEDENASYEGVYKSNIQKPFEWLDVDCWELISSIADASEYRELDDWYAVLAEGRNITDTSLDVPDVSIGELHKLYNQQFSVLLGETLKYIGESLINKDIVIKFTK